MSWREVARRVLASDEDEAEAIGGDDQREAVAMIDGGLPPSWGAALSMMEREPRPYGVSEKEWRSRLAAVWARAADHGADFVAHGWTFEEVFGVGAHWWRFLRAISGTAGKVPNIASRRASIMWSDRLDANAGAEIPAAHQRCALRIDSTGTAAHRAGANRPSAGAPRQDPSGRIDCRGSPPRCGLRSAP